MIRETGKIFESDHWPLAVWRKLERLAKFKGITPSLCISELLQEEIGRNAGVKIEPSDVVIGQLVRLARILEIDPGSFGCTIIGRYMQEIFEYGKLEELEVSGVSFDTKEKHDRVTKNAKSFDSWRDEARRERRAA